MATEFILTGIENESRKDPRHSRIVCYIKDGGLMAIWGRHGKTKHIDEVDAAGFPCAVACVWREPEDWAKEYGHTHWVEENAAFTVTHGPSHLGESKAKS